MAAHLKHGDTVLCPLCNAPQEDKVEDYVVPGFIGMASEAEDECHECGAYFTVIRTAADEFEVLAV